MIKKKLFDYTGMILEEFTCVRLWTLIEQISR